MSSLRAAVRVTLNDPRLLATAAAAAFAELALRILLGWAVNPVLALLVPPIAVVGLGLLAPGVRGALSEELPVEFDAAEAKSRVPTLVAAAFCGHAVALALGAAAFLVADTPVRAALYWLGYGDALTPVVLMVSPLWGVAAGTLVAWAVLAPAVVRVGEGGTIRRSFAATVAAVVRAPRTVAAGVGWHLAFAGSVSLVVFAGVRYGADFRSPILLVGIAGGLTFLVATFALAFLAAFHVGRSDETRTGDSPRASIPVARFALVVLLLTGLVGAAGAVRVVEFRPTDAAPDPLPDDPDAMYATAFENTEQANHAYRVAIAREEGEPFVIEHRIDRTDRQYRQIPSGVAAGPSVYAAPGTGSPPLTNGLAAFALDEREVGESRTVRASPDYLQWAGMYSWDDDSGLTPPSPSVEGWEVVERDDGEIVLELTDPAAVFAAVQGREADGVTDANASRIRAVIDAERGTLSAVETRLNATVVVEGSERRYDGRTTHEFEVGVDVERPDELGPPSVGEWVWRLFVY